MIDLFLFSFLNLLGAMSPGPDFAVVTKYGITGSKRAAILASCGVAAALLIHVFYCVSGIAVFLHSMPHILRIIRILGAIYLGYLGLSIFFRESSQDNSASKATSKNAFFDGFITNLLNPKATVFLLSLFSQFAASMNSLGMKIAYALAIPLIALSWFSVLTHFMTHPRFLPYLQKHRRKFMLIMGCVLCFLSISGILTGILS